MNAAEAIGVGAGLGFLSGLFGVGGSSVATPVLRMLGVPPLLALATPLPVTIPTAIVGGLTYWKRKMVDGRAALLSAAGGVPAVIVGSLLTQWAPARLLMMLTGVVVTLAGARVLVSAKPADGARPWSDRSLVAVGVVVGFLSGLLANGGGFLLVPAYLLLFAMEAHTAAATSLVAVALLGLPATAVHGWLGHIDPKLALELAVGVIPFTWLGAQAGMRIDDKHVRRLFGVFLVGFGLFFAIRTGLRAGELGWRH